MKLKPLHSERQPAGQAGGALVCEWNASGAPAARLSAHTAHRLTRRAVSGSVVHVAARPEASPTGWSPIMRPVPTPSSSPSVKTGCATVSIATSPEAMSPARCPRGADADGVGGSSQLGPEGRVVSAVADRK